MVVTSGLPLLMVRGRFASLETMSISDLETFVPFMTMCSIHRASSALTNNVPVWWLSSVKFEFPLSNPRGLSSTGYRRHLISIVCRCYHYHEQQYLLHFCNQVSRNPDSVVTKENEDNTTSLFYSKSSLHILTFNNENKNYDKNLSLYFRFVGSPGVRKTLKSRRCLLPSKRKKTITDVYLCENCDSDFTSQAAIIAHERLCYGQVEPTSCETEPTPGDLLSYLQLEKLPRTVAKISKPHNEKRSLISLRAVEFSSLLGQRLLVQGSKRGNAVKSGKNGHSYESFCTISQRSSKGRDNYELRNVIKVVHPLKAEYLPDRYCFKKRERYYRYLTLKTGLDQRSRNLLKKCRKCYVKLKRYVPPPPVVAPKIETNPRNARNVKLVSSNSTANSVELINLISSDEEI